MTGQLSLLSRAIGRAALGVFATASLVMLLAPVAAASPETDAGDAINQAWDASGGAAGSPVGDKTSDVYAVGDGFGQNFTGGKIYFTPATGARLIYGAINDKYESLGGPANSDLGFPTIDEVAGLVGPDSRVSTFSASDKPAIFWTADTGAWVVRGAINAAWDKLGGSAGTLGVPVQDETYDGDLVNQKFTGGQLSWNRRTKEFTTVPPELAGQLAGLEVPGDATAAINLAWRAAGGASGPLGPKQGGQFAVGDKGVGQNFEGGKVYFSPDTGAYAVGGQILAKYESLGGPTGNLGFPNAGEADGGMPGTRVSTFAAADNPVIFWTPAHGAVVVRGAMNAAWTKLGGATGALGVPISDQTIDGDNVTQKFSGGEISWNKAKNTFATKPPDLASSLSGLQVPAQQTPNQQSGPAANAKTDKGFTWHWWWLLIIIPVLLLLGVLALLGVWLRRRRGKDQVVAGADEFESEAPAYDADAGHESHWPAEQADATGSFADRDAQLSAYSPYNHGGHDPDDHGAEFRWSPTETAGAASVIGGAHARPGAQGLPEEFQEDPDAVDTAPTRIESDSETPSGRHAAIDLEAAQTVWRAVDDDRSGASELIADPGFDEDEPAAPPAVAIEQAAEPEPELEPHVDAGPAHPAIHLPLEDPYEPPPGYSIKANTHSGLYYTPECALYDHTVPELWFASEEVARANGFIKAE
jgi:uncharacterized protein with LGFP repeats